MSRPSQAARNLPWEVLATCPSCLVEGAALEIMDPLHPSSRFGVPLERRCGLCGRVDRCDPAPILHDEPGVCPRCATELPTAAREGQAGCERCGLRPQLVTHVAPIPLNSHRAATEALERFALAQGAPDVATFCEANLGGPVEHITQRLMSGLPIHSSLDVLAFLFPGAHGGSSSSSAVDAQQVFAPVSPPKPTPTPPPPPVDPLQQAKLLASVAVADGQLRADERTFAQSMLRREGWPELPEAQWRVYRPWETGPPPAPEVAAILLEAAVQLSHLDHERDASEWKVILAYAAAWGVSEERLHELDRRWTRRHTTLFTQLITWLNTQVRLH